VVVLIGLLVFFWKREGPGSGRAYGNKIAAHIGIQRSVFWALLENGAPDSAHKLLSSLQSDRTSIDAASVKISPVLVRGIERLEARFGTQEMYERAKPHIANVLARAEGAGHGAGDRL
jgi:hypothetical protein